MADALPTTPKVIARAGADSSVKVSDPQYVLFNDDVVSIETMTNLLFEDIGGEEIINISRNDTVFGANLSYDIIANSGLISKLYNSQNIVSLGSNSYDYFRNFLIQLETKIPNVGSGTNGSNVYMNKTTGELVLEFINLEKDEQIEINILTQFEDYRDTI
jgi:hypothetical protein